VNKSEIEDFECKALHWPRHFKQLYGSQEVMSYIHILIYHTASLMKRFGSLEKFGNYGLEVRFVDSSLLSDSFKQGHHYANKMSFALRSNRKNDKSASIVSKLLRLHHLRFLCGGMSKQWAEPSKKVIIVDSDLVQMFDLSIKPESKPFVPYPTISEDNFDEYNQYVHDKLDRIFSG
jgi:hypothetical protein